MSDENPKFVLIVDDDDLLREFYTRVLKSLGYEVVCASNGDSAISVLDAKNNNIALVIADLLMPIRTGWELIEYMKNKEDLKNIPIIAVTGLAASLDEFRQVKSTCNAVLHKGDFDLDKFKKVIKDILE